MKLITPDFGISSRVPVIQNVGKQKVILNNFDDDESMNALVMSTEVGGQMIKTLPLESMYYYYFMKVMVVMESGTALDYFLAHPYASTFQYHTDRYVRDKTTTKAERLDTGTGPFQVTNDFVHDYFIINRNKVDISKYLTAHISFVMRRANDKLVDIPAEQFMSVWWFVFTHSRRFNTRNVNNRQNAKMLKDMLGTKLSQSKLLQGNSLEKYYDQLQHDFNQFSQPIVRDALKGTIIELYHRYYGNSNSRVVGNSVNKRLSDTVNTIIG